MAATGPPSPQPSPAQHGQQQPLVPLAPLPHPVHFVFKETERWPELFSGAMPPPVEEVADRFMGARNSWVVQSYIQLRRRGLEVSLVPGYVPGRICVTSYEDLRISDRPFTSFVVACRHDRGRPEICDLRIVQNQLNVVDDTDHYLPHWPQPAIRPRDPERGTRVESIAYHGRTPSLDPAFRGEAFRDALAQRGMELVTGEVDNTAKRAQWADYRTADVVLAVRHLTPAHLAVKPPSKLLNAWIAGCPALLGPEPAYRQLRRSDLDYLEVGTPEEALAALDRLRVDPGLYTAMVENGRRRAAELTPDRIAGQWRDLLAGPVAERYEAWQGAPAWQRALRPATFVGRAVKHRRARQRYRSAIAADA